jgi:hypothetical protein
MKLSRRNLFAGLAAAMLAVTGLGMTVAAQGKGAMSENCCCVVEDGQFLCTITGELMEECCCR